MAHRVGFIPVPDDGVPREKGVALGVAWLKPRHPKALLVPQMRQYEESDLLRQAVPRTDVATSRADRRLRVTPAAAVLACWPMNGDLDTLHRHASQGGAVAIIRWDNGWAERAWIDSLGAVNLVTGAPGSGIPSPSLDPVVAEGMKSLQGINHSSWHQSDQDRVKWTLLNLPRNGHHYSPDDLAVWAACNGFRMHEAMELRDLAKRVCDGHTFRISRRPYRADVIDMWRQAAGQPTRSHGQRRTGSVQYRRGAEDER